MAMGIYGCSPFVMWAMLLTDKRKGDLLISSVFKQMLVWIVILVFSFIAFNVERNAYIEERKEIKYSQINDYVGENNKDVMEEENSANEIIDRISQNNPMDSNVSEIDMNSSELEQKLFDSINYALSIGVTSNCDMSQETLKEIYTKIGDGSFFEESMFSYVTEYGKDRYNYEISYDALNVVVYCDYDTGVYGFEILEND